MFEKKNEQTSTTKFANVKGVDINGFQEQRNIQKYVPNVNHCIGTQDTKMEDIKEVPVEKLKNCKIYQDRGRKLIRCEVEDDVKIVREGGKVF